MEVKAQIEEDFDLHEFVEFSIYDSASSEDVRESITEMLEQVQITNEVNSFRMPIDRVFSVKGHGVVVTGSAISGQVQIGDKLEILPSKDIVRVKGIQVFKTNVAVAFKNTRVAINITGIKKEDLKRGKIISTPEKVLPTKMLDVKIITSNNEGSKLKHLETVKFNYLASEVKCRVKLFKTKVVGEGETVYGQLLLEDELFAVNGDLGVLRKVNPNVTVAGIEIINVQGKYASRKDEGYVDKIKVIEEGNISTIVSDYVETEFFASKKSILNDLGVSDEEFGELELDFISTENTYITKHNFEVFKGRVLNIVTDYHNNNKTELSMNKGELLTELNTNLTNKIFTKFLGLISELEVLNYVKLKTFEISLSVEEKKVSGKLISALNSNGFKPPKYNELKFLVGSSITYDVYFTLIKQGRVIKVDDDIAITKEKLLEITNIFDDFFESNSLLTLIDARELLNSSRRYVVPYLEYLDKIGYTRRVDNGRMKKGVVN